MCQTTIIVITQIMSLSNKLQLQYIFTTYIYFKKMVNLNMCPALTPPPSFFFVN